ncbi:hypothetical protein RBB50_011836 [Rhinocladiella similis]
MKLSGSDKGSGSNTYFRAAEFFKRRQLAGVKTSSSRGPRSSSTKKPRKDQIAETEAASDVSHISLAGEDTDAVPVMDTCDDVRNKINKYLRETPYSSFASFTRTINLALSDSSERQGSPQTLTHFLGASGPRKGAESLVFYTAYVFFEKLRIKQNKPKSQKRLDMERVWGPRGIELKDSARTRFFVGPGLPDMYEDQYGKLQPIT